MKKISKVLLSSAVCTSLAYGASFEYPQLYKDQKTMGMGGASVATGGTAASLFSNPAGLSKIPKKYGWEVNIIDLNISTNDEIIDFADDLDAIEGADKDEESQKVLDLLEKNLGNNLHVSATVSPFNISKTFDEYSFSIMPIGGLYANLTPHRGNGSEGLLEANGMGYAGLAVGISKKLDDFKYNNIHIKNINVGLGLKAIKYQVFNHNLTTAEIVDNKDDVLEYLTDDIADEGTSVVADLGIQAQTLNNFDIGLSVMNIGGIGEKSKFEIPMTVNAGVAYTLKYPNRVYFDKLVIAADYIDILQEYKDEDFIKRTRLGVNAHLLDGWLGSISTQVGLYQGYLSYGVDFRFSAVKIAYTSYSEEIGPESNRFEDRRHMLSFNIGW